jgi:NAD(P)-dependent dehydrogenase (short-subunit alcohol dehydrogenase family)
VTATGQGIGRASALAFAREGARVVINDVDATRLEDTAAEIRKAGGEVVALAGDAGTEAHNEVLVAAAVEHHGGLDVMHLVAGGARPMPTLDHDAALYREIVARNLDSCWFGTLAALRVMVPAGSGSIIATSAGAGLGAVMGLSAYAATKAGVAALMRGVAQEHGGNGIRANTISPGPMETPGLVKALSMTPAGVEGFEAQIPLGSLGRAEDIADAAVFLASDEARYISGVNLPVDGAIHSTLSSPNPMA